MLARNGLPFLTKYDPFESPGGTVDPLGFFLPYTRLANEWMPDLTNAGTQPRYCSMLCRAATLALEASRKEGLTGSDNRRFRLEIIKRYERIWVLACTAAMGVKAEGIGLRGITFAQRELLKRTITTEFSLLGNQMRYGAMGIYAPMSIGLELLTPGYLPRNLGFDLSNAFPADADIDWLAAQAKGGILERDKLIEWGMRSRIGKMLVAERRILREALDLSRQRKLALELLESIPVSETELSNFTAVRERLRDKVARSDLEESRMHLLDLILRFEEFYRTSMLGFERVRWNASTAGSGWKPSESDSILSGHLQKAKERATDFLASDEAMRLIFGSAQASMIFSGPIRLAHLTSSCSDRSEWADTLVAHHREVQLGRFGETTRKAPWIYSDRGALFIGANRYRMYEEVTSFDQLEPHSYKSSSALNFIGRDQVV